MRLAISNIAWDSQDDEAIAELLHRFRVDAIDVAPGKYFSEPASALRTDIAMVKDRWAGWGIEITGMQALLFGTTGLNMFGSAQIQRAMMTHLAHVCRIGGELGASRVVFGSPKNRDRNGLSDQQSLDIAVSFFKELGDVAQASGVVICLEPNPTHYGANFMTSSLETAQVVRYVDHAAIRMQFDTGSLAINGEDPAVILGECSELIGHVHASERDLVPLGDGDTAHLQMAAALRHYLPGHIVTVEMLETTREPALVSIERALNVAHRFYRSQRH